MASKLLIKLLPGAKAPERAHPTDAGFDVFALEDCAIKAGVVTPVRTGVCVHPQPLTVEEARKLGLHAIGYYNYNRPGGWTYACLIWDKSGLGSKGFKVHGGVIDDPYTGELIVMLSYNIFGIFIDNLIGFFKHIATFKKFPDVQDIGKLVPNKYEIVKGAKLANLIVQRVELPVSEIVEELPFTDRGTNGFGSTGV